MVKKLLFIPILVIFTIFLAPSAFAQCATGPGENAFISITLESGSTTICSDENISFSSSVNTNGGSGHTYQWQVKTDTGNWINISGENSSSLTFSNVQNNSRFRLKAIFCGGTADEEVLTSSQSSSITVNDVKEGSVTIVANAAEICPGEEVTYSVSDIKNHGGSSASYDWRVNGSATNPASNSQTFTYTPTSSDKVELHIISGAPCVEPFSSQSISISEKNGIPSQPGNFTNGPNEICPGKEATYTVPNDPTATEYIWKLPADWSGSSSTNSINITSGPAGTATISVTAKNSCGESEPRQLTVTIGPDTPVQPGEITITGNPEYFCPNQEYTFEASVSDSNLDYFWEYPTGWNLVSENENEITLQPQSNAQDGKISLFVKNSCEVKSEGRTLDLSLDPSSPAPIEIITGPAEACPGEEITYSVEKDPNVFNYNWNIPTGWTLLTDNGQEIIVKAGNYGQDGSIEVTAENNCGNSSQQKTISVKPGTPAEPVISGVDKACSGMEESYSINEVDFTSEYTWTFPSDWNVNNSGTNTITVGPGTLSVDVIPGINEGNITVTAINSCGENSSSIATEIKAPAPKSPGAITYPNEDTRQVCMGTAENYSVAPIADATSYIWELPGETKETTTPEVLFTTNSAGTLTLSVAAVNSCGSSTPTSFDIEVTAGEPGTPGPITSDLENASICPPTNTDINFSISQVEGAEYYEWELPTGWEITNDERSNSIEVKVHASSTYSDNESLQVRAWNICGPGPWSTLSEIAVDEYVITNAGEDKILCSSLSAVEIKGEYSFAGSNKNLKPVWSVTSGMGTFLDATKLNTTFTPTQAALDAGQVTLTLTTEAPSGGCGPGKDEMSLHFKEDPTVQISGSTEICYESSTEITFFEGTENAVVTYTTNGSNPKTINLDANGTATLNTGNLTSTVTYELVSIAYNDTPECSNEISGSVNIKVDPDPTATLTYDPAELCNSDTQTYSPNLDITGTSTGGSYSAPAELGINADGEFSPLGVPAGTYTITYNFDDPLECGFEPVSTELTIFEEVLISEQPTDIRICEGDEFQLSVEATGDNLSYQWYKGSGSGTEISGATSSVFTISQSEMTDNDVYYVRISGSSPCPDLQSNVVTVVVDEAIGITSQPEDSVICEEGSAEFSVVASAGEETLEYQWYKGAPGSGSMINGETGSVYSIDPVQLSDAGDYYVEISGASGFLCEPVNSQAATLTVRETPTVEIFGDIEICDGENVDINFSNGTPNALITYTINGGSQQTVHLDASGEATVNTEALSATSNTAADYVYELISVEYPDAPECKVTASGSATVTVNPLPTANFDFNNDQLSFCNDPEQVTVTPTLSGTGDFENGIFSANGLDIDPTDGTFSPAGKSAGTYLVNYTIPASGGCEEVIVSKEITIFNSIVITSEPYNVGVCTANSTHLEIAATGDNLNYQWYKAGTATKTVGTNSPVYDISNATLNDSGEYYVVISGETACEAITSETVTVNVDENILVEEDDQPISQDLCTGDILELSIEANATGGSPEYQWRKNGTPTSNSARISGATTSNLTITDLETGDAGDYDVLIKGPDGYTCEEGYSTVAVITVTEPPQADAGPDLTFCYNTGATNITEGASAENYSIVEWTSDGAGNISEANSLTAASYTPGENETGTIILTLTAFGNATCAEVISEKILEIEPIPVITAFSYSAEEFCQTDNEIKAPATLTGENAYENGTYSYSGTGYLELEPTTGNIDPSLSEPGVYEVIYSTPEGAVCEVVESEPFTISIGEEPVADFEYDATIYCKDTRDPGLNTAPEITIFGEAGEFTYTGTGNLSLTSSTGAIDLNNSDAGTYTITNTVDFSGAEEDGCAPVSAEYTINISEKPIPDFSYPQTAFCSTVDKAEIELPAGAVKGVFTTDSEDLTIDAATGEIDIDGSVPGTYIITNTVEIEDDGCPEVSAEFEITINQLPDAAFTYSQESYCVSSKMALVDPAFEEGGSFSSTTLNSYLDTATGEINWEENDDLIGSHTIDYTIPAGAGCEEVSSSTTISIDPLPIGGALDFDGFGRVFMICEDPKGSYAVPLNLTRHFGEIVVWKYRGSSENMWTEIKENGENFTGTSLNAQQIESLNVSETTIFQVEISSGACSPNVLSKNAILSVIPSDIEPAPVTVTPEVVCYGEEVTLSSSTGYASGFDITGGAFDNSSITNHGWRVRRDGSSQDLNFESSADNARPALWLRTTPKDFYTANINNPGSGSNQRWDSGAEDNKGFAIVSGNNPSTLETPVFNTFAMDKASLTFSQAYNLTEGDTIRVEISTDGGATYQSIPLYEEAGPTNSGNINRFGLSTEEENKININLEDYLGQGNLRIRFHYMGKRDGTIWSVDDIDFPDGPNDVSMEWTDYTDPENPEYIGDSNSEPWTPKEIGWNTFEVQTLLLFNTNGEACASATNSQSIQVYVYDNYTSSASASVSGCGDYEARLTGTITGLEQGEIETLPEGDEATLVWEVVTGPEDYTFSEDHFSPAPNDPAAIFTPDIAGSYTLRWTIIKDEENTCEVSYEEVTFELIDCIALDFDGIDDYIDMGDNYSGSFSMEAWIRPKNANGTIISKRDKNNTGSGYELILNNGKPVFRWNGGILTSSNSLELNKRWYHLAVNFEGNAASFYVDGIKVVDKTTGSSVSNSTAPFLIGASFDIETQETSNHFSGWIEEVRIWNRAITENQIRFLMNQRLIDNGTQMGAELPMDVPEGMSYADLAGYYRLIADINLIDPVEPEFGIMDGATPDMALNSIPGKLKNMETFQENTAPLPYISNSNNSWTEITTWLYPEVWDIPNANGINGDPIEWNIVKTFHNINSGNKDITVLGLISENGELEMASPNSAQDETNEGKMLRITHYLKLNGFIDLTGESQLLQDTGSIVDSESTGILERDQQGTESSYNYNYWSSPVSPGTDNTPYTVGGVMRDGSDSYNPGALSFGQPYAYADGGYSTPPKRISTYWIHRFHGLADDYDSWVYVGKDGPLKVGEGYTMKGTSGTAAILDLQNYTFEGIPNNGDFTLNISKDENYLVGNPYPSALDANQFIKDNLKDHNNTANIFNGTLYFWSHFAGTTHFLSEYIGGYATYNLSGGVKAIANDERINDTDEEGGKIPQRYIPVGQAFFVNTVLDGALGGTSVIDGGPIEFKNSQRIYKREGEESVFHKPENNTKEQKSETDTREKIWLKFHSPSGYRRQLLVTADSRTSNNFDLGFDAQLIEDNEEDLYWFFNDSKFVIQGVPNLNADQELALGIKVENEEIFTIEIDQLENIPDKMEIYLKDSIVDVFFDLREAAYESTAKAGTNNERFKIVFKKPQAVEEEIEGIISGDLEIKYVNNTREVIILNPQLLKINRINLNNMLGQQVHVYDEIPVREEVKLPVHRFSSGVYIVRMYTENGLVTKKIILE